MPSNILKTTQTPKEDSGAKRFNLSAIIITIVFLALVCILFPTFRKKFFIENPDLFIKNINVTETANYAGPKTEGKISVYTILSEIGVEVGNNNIISLDIRKIRKRLEDEAILKNVEVRKRLPDTLDIQFQERIPQARIYAGSNTCYIDKDGIILPPRYKDDTVLQYDTVYVVPNIVAIRNQDELQPGVKVNDKHLLAALSLIDKIHTNPENTYLRIKQIQINEDGEMLIVHATAMQGSDIFASECKFTLPFFEMDNAIKDLFHLAGELKKETKRKVPPIRSLDLTIRQKPTITP